MKYIPNNLFLVTGALASCLLFASCAEMKSSGLVLSSGTTDQSKMAFKNTYSDGQCHASTRWKSESPYKYATRLNEVATVPNEGLDIDCIVNQFSEYELKKYAKANDYTAIFALNAELIVSNVNGYCGGTLNLYGAEDINYQNRVKYRDYLPEYYLFLARIKKYVCEEYLASYPFYLAAEATGSSVSPLEKGL